MQSHQIKRKIANKKSRSVGRGGKLGKTSGRGTIGQKARAGAKFRPEIRDFIKRLPKIRGRGKNSNLPIGAKFIPINVGAIESAFNTGDSITPATLIEKGLIRSRKGSQLRVKILGGGDLTKKIAVSGCAVSVEAKAKIEKAGGTVA